MTTPAPARPAATVIVLRPAAAQPFEVLLVRRNDQVAFMAGAYVFPGGRVDDTDDALALDERTTARRCLDLSSADEGRYRVAAIRELLEEAGVLLARGAGGFADQATTSAVRASLPAHSSLVGHLARHGLTAAIDAVMPFAHWVTPEIEIRRYDTRFLLARVPEGQEGSHDAGETTALEWLSPVDALARADRRELMLPPPTWTTLNQLSRFSSIDAAWHWASTTPMVRIQPGFVRDGDVSTLTLPGDPLCPPVPGCEAFDVTRFQLSEGGHWRPVRR
jgi:8-oxo-dGTP pyrophosphatase MutT (NUDIX family)